MITDGVSLEATTKKGLHVRQIGPLGAGLVVKITLEAVERIFRDCVGRRPPPSKEELQDITNQLNIPWGVGYAHGLWALRRAIRVVLDDAPRVIEAERRHPSVQARKREDAYSQLLEAAQAVCDAGVPIPQMDDAPPKTKQALSVANPDHRDWKLVFGLVNTALKTANWKKVGRGASSPSGHSAGEWHWI